MRNLVENRGLTRRTAVVGGLTTMATLGQGAHSMPNTKKREIFDRERFVEDCINANKERDSVAAVKEVLQRAVSNTSAVLKGIGEPKQAGLDVLLTSPTLTIFAANWTPQMNLLPHDHHMWAMIGIYTGREDNILWREGDDGIEAYGANCLFEGDVATMEVDDIHSVTNPLPRFTGGIHIYGGDFFAEERHQWDPETLARQRSDGDVIRDLFARENERFAKISCG